MGWNDSNDWFIGPMYEMWTYEEMPQDIESVETIAKVRAIFPNTFVFKDTHVYDNQSLSGKIYGIGECSDLIIDEPIMIVGDYSESRQSAIGRTQIRIRGKWAVSIYGAWENAWNQIQETMLEKFSR